MKDELWTELHNAQNNLVTFKLLYNLLPLLLDVFY